MTSNSSRLSPPFTGLLLYLLALIAAITLGCRPNGLNLLCLPLLIVLYHGTHEAVHDTLIPFGIPARRPLAALLGIVGFALLGHNFYLLKWSHNQHHTFGRIAAESSLDGPHRAILLRDRVMYYLGLLGVVSFLHEFAGYWYLIPGSHHFPLFPGFRPQRYSLRFFVAQLTVLVMTAFLIIQSHGWYLVTRGLFAVYCGTMQNVSHFGLEIGSGPHPELAARTYRLPRMIEFLLFRAGFYHVEHHAFPQIPGLHLSNPVIQDRLFETYGIQPRVSFGFRRYVLDAFRQFNGPVSANIDPTEWRLSQGP